AADARAARARGHAAARELRELLRRERGRAGADVQRPGGLPRAGRAGRAVQRPPGRRHTRGRPGLGPGPPALHDATGAGGIALPAVTGLSNWPRGQLSHVRSSRWPAPVVVSWTSPVVRGGG